MFSKISIQEKIVKKLDFSEMTETILSASRKPQAASRKPQAARAPRKPHVLIV
jgi:hypothetical protein